VTQAAGPLYIVLIGPPGAGKGTQARLLAEALGIPHVASGDLFREHLKNETELGLLAKRYVDQGELVPDEVTIRMVMERLGQPDCAAGAILDGFPRTLQQARALDEALEAKGQRIKVVPLLVVDDDEVIERLAGRRICRHCQAVYHIKYNPPAQPGVCDRCGGELYQRSDDTVETVRNRLFVYYKQTAPLVGYYFAHHLLVEVDGQQSIEAVQADLLAAVRR